MTLMEILKTYGAETLGYPSESTLKRLYELSPDLDKHLHDLLLEPIRSIRCPYAHVPTATKGMFIAEPEIYTLYVQAMLGNRYNKTYSITQAQDLLKGLDVEKYGAGFLSNVWNRIETLLKLADKRRTQKKINEERTKEANAKGKQYLCRNTEAKQKALAKATKVRKEQAAIRQAERDLKNAKRRLAKEAVKSGVKPSELRKTTKEREEAKGQLEKHKDTIKNQGKKVLYEPTAKQAEFHAADEDIVLYGGAAGG